MERRVRKKSLLKLSVAGVGIVLVLALGTFLFEMAKIIPTEPAPEKTFNPSGDFTLTSDNGNVFHLSDLRGNPVLLFFGYTSCPDACPTTLAKINRALALLGSDRKQFQTVFITVDPERDTPAKLQEYLAYFGINAVGLVGTKAQIDAVVHAYHAYYQKSASQSALGYTITHTTTVYLIDRQGQVRHLFKQVDTAKTMAETLKEFL